MSDADARARAQLVLGRLSKARRAHIGRASALQHVAEQKAADKASMAAFADVFRKIGMEEKRRAAL
jgi:hypothetical protein